MATPSASPEADRRMARTTHTARTARTRSALLRAFNGLLLSEGFESITVAALVQRAGVGRSTFYTHFRGRDDILRESLTWPSGPLARIVGHAVEPGALLPMIGHFQQNRRLGRAFAGGSLRRLWVRRLAEMIEPDVGALARRLRARPLLPIPMVALQLAEAQVALVVHALGSRAPVPAEALARALVELTRGNVATLLQCDAGMLPR